MGKIVWLASYPKSGNTWLRLFLYAYFKLDPAKTDRIDLNDPGISAFSTQDVNRHWFDPFLGVPCETSTLADAARCRVRAHRMIAEATPGIAMVKTHNSFEADHGVPNITAEVTAGAIYIVRNPLDVVVSVKNHFGHRSMGDAIAMLNASTAKIDADEKRVANFIGSWSRNVESWAGDRRQGIFPVRYEDMLADPEKIFGWIIGVLGHEVDEERLKWAVAATSFGKLRAAEDETGFGEGSSRSQAFFRKGVANDWRDALTTGQVRKIVEKNHEMMRRFGYLDEKLERFAPKPKAKAKKLKARR